MGPGESNSVQSVENVVDRRLGIRKELDSVVGLDWEVPGRRGIFGRRAKPVAARLVDVSVTGAAIAAPAEPRPPIGTRVTIRVAQMEGTVVVARVAGSGWADVVIYGVRFGHLDQDLTAALHALVASDRPDPELLRVWQQSF